MIDTKETFISSHREPGLNDSEANVPTASVRDVLTEGLLHKIMLFFHLPANWPMGAMILVAGGASPKDPCMGRRFCFPGRTALVVVVGFTHCFGGSRHAHFVFRG